MENTMLNSKLLISSAVAAVTSLAASGAFAGPAPQPNYSFEKCFGVVKAGLNDCSQPIASEDEQIQIVVNGEFYGYESI
jgi:uncharacterized membrane protein